jgi:hypothetical protein
MQNPLKSDYDVKVITLIQFADIPIENKKHEAWIILLNDLLINSIQGLINTMWALGLVKSVNSCMKNYV